MGMVSGCQAVWFVMPGWSVCRGGLGGRRMGDRERRDDVAPTTNTIFTVGKEAHTSRNPHDRFFWFYWYPTHLTKPVDRASLSSWARLVDRESVGASGGRALGGARDGEVENLLTASISRYPALNYP